VKIQSAKVCHQKDGDLSLSIIIVAAIEHSLQQPLLAMHLRELLDQK
jgi:hypothetical protein